MLFSQVLGQKELKEKMIRLINEERMPHAINLLGSEGSGNLPLALAIAQYINCKQKTETDSCGKCSSCVKIQKLQHPDLHLSFPVVATGNTSPPTSTEFYSEFRDFVLQNAYASDIDWLHFLGKEKQGNITAAECREIIQKLMMRSYESEYKILIMWYPEYLGKEGNILLKQIEEPTPKTILIFVTQSIDQLLLTIQSRTQLFPLKRLSVEEVQQGLIGKGINNNQALQYARIADGNFNEALKLLQQKEDEHLTSTRNWLNYLFSNNGLQIVNWVYEMAETSKENQKKFLTNFIQLLEHALRLKQNTHINIHLLEEEKKLIETLLKKELNEQKIEFVNKLLNESIYHIERNANTKILFHSVSLQIQQTLVYHKIPIQNV